MLTSGKVEACFPSRVLAHLDDQKVWLNSSSK